MYIRTHSTHNENFSNNESNQKFLLIILNEELNNCYVELINSNKSNFTVVNFKFNVN